MVKRGSKGPGPLGLLAVLWLLLAGCTGGAGAAAGTGSAGATAVTPAAVSGGPPPLTPTPLPSPAPAAPEIQDIKERGRLVVAMYAQDRYPFFYVNPAGQLVGADVDLALEIGRSLGVEVEFDRTARLFDEVVTLVASGEADVAISKLSVTLPRAERLLYTRPYVSLQQGLLINRKAYARIREQPPDPLAALNRPGRTVGVLKDSSYVFFARRLFAQAQIVPIEPKEALFQAVLAGDLLAVLYDENEIKGYIYEQPDRLIDLQVVMIPGQQDQIAMAVSWQSRHLHAWLNQYLALRDDIPFAIDTLLERYPRPEGKSPK